MIFRLNDHFPALNVPAHASKAVHLIGILGAGMSALAKLFLERGWQVSGGDSTANDRLGPLRDAGAQVRIGKAPSDLANLDLIVYSPAIAWDHPDLVQARSLGVPLMTRARALAGLLEGRPVISVAGSHGKTTTTAMLAVLLERAGLRPGYMVGEACQTLEAGNARWSDIGPFVNESCEAFRALDFWMPVNCIVTGIDDEHSDHYGSFDDLEAAFGDFMHRLPEGGRILVCSDDEKLCEVSRGQRRHVEDFGTSEGALWRARIRELNATETRFDLYHRGQFECSVYLPLPGKHNALNALAAIAMATGYGCAPSWSAKILAEFTSVPRRWQRIGCWAGVSIYDDIAHHPSEVAVTLNNARRVAGPLGRLVAVLQPQLISRLRRLEDAFLKALSIADQVVLLPVDTAGEHGSGDDIGASLCDRLQEAGVQACRARTIDEALPMVAGIVKSGDCVVAMGPALAHNFATALPDFLGGRSAMPPKAEPSPEEAASPPRLLHSWFEEQVSKRPDALCLVERERAWTYGEIDAEAEKVAACLIARALPRDALVVLAIEKSGWFLALVLGVLKAGCAFVPIDPAMRRAALNDLLHLVGAALVIEGTTATAAPATALPTIDLDTFLKEVKQVTAPVARLSLRPSHLAYGIFTSGSTGAPRLVGVSHENVSNLIEYSIGQLFTPEDLKLTPFIDSISFDACVHQMFATLSCGGCLLLEKDLASLVQSDRFQQITNLGGTPSVLGSLATSGRLPSGIRVISLGGEVIPQGLIAMLRKHQGLKKIYNFYGPTETTIFSTVAELLGGAADSPRTRAGTNIGYPVAGTTIRILDPEGNELPVGKAGEITVAGKGVARGYLGDPVQTAARFGAATDGRQFLTKDLGQRLADGSIDFLGRMDDQIKFKGVRLDPVEIEIQIEACDGIERAAVVHGQADGGDSILAAFVVAAPGTDMTRLRQHLAGQLPKVMVPGLITRVDSLPMTATGKVLRRELAQLVPASLRSSEEPALLDGVERRVLQIWQSVLGRPDLSKDHDFFDAGGDSLASMQMVLTVEKAFGIRLSAQTMESLGTVAAMSADIRRQVSDPSSVKKARRDLGVRLLDQQRAYLAGWSDGKIRQSGFVRSLDGMRGPAGLVWCCQGFNEYRALAEELQEDLPVYGMRSGHLIMEYSPDTIQSLALLYRDELLKWQPEGPFLLGGNCQGATIARATALALRALGREVSGLILMEQFSIWPYDQRVGLIFGRDSLHNPFSRQADPVPMLDSAYPSGFGLRIVEGGHGHFFSPENIGSLADGIRTLLPWNDSPV